MADTCRAVVRWIRLLLASWHLGADSSIATYRSVLRAHIDLSIGGKPIGAIRRCRGAAAGSAAWVQVAVRPPSTGMVTPWMKLASSLAR
jgi:hypothetical protein